MEEGDNRADWIAPSREASGADFTAWAAMLELEPYDETAPEDPAAITLMVDQQKEEKYRTTVQLYKVLQWAMFFKRPALILRCLCTYAAHQHSQF